MSQLEHPPDLRRPHLQKLMIFMINAHPNIGDVTNIKKLNLKKRETMTISKNQRKVQFILKFFIKI
jgi:hypothetical protein